MLVAIFCSALLAAGLAGQTPSSDVIELPDHERISVTAYQAGRGEAEKDVRENRLIIETFGLPTPWDGDYARILDQRYHIELKRVAGDVVDYKIVGHAKGYNEVSKAEIQHRFGSDVLEKTRSEVQKRWKENHSE